MQYAGYYRLRSIVWAGTAQRVVQDNFDSWPAANAAQPQCRPVRPASWTSLRQPPTKVNVQCRFMWQVASVVVLSFATELASMALLNQPAILYKMQFDTAHHVAWCHQSFLEWQPTLRHRDA
jgi:hypothetical protein